MNDAHETAFGYDIPRCNATVLDSLFRQRYQFIDFFLPYRPLLFHLYHFKHLLLHNCISCSHQAGPLSTSVPVPEL